MDDILALMAAGKVSGKDGKAYTAVKDGIEYIGLYFSAHWCPPCRGFTPVLAKYYNDVKDKGLEVVFVSSDQDEDSWKEYYDSMPWLALKFGDDSKAALSTKYGVQGIPTLVILNKDGSTKTANGRACVMKNTESKELNFEG